MSKMCQYNKKNSKSANNTTKTIPNNGIFKNQYQ